LVCSHHPRGQVVVVSISGGTYVTPYANVVDYTATLLGGGGTDDTIRTLMSNMTSGATLEFPMVRPNMLLDGSKSHRFNTGSHKFY
jgi:hypothetical protein